MQQSESLESLMKYTFRPSWMMTLMTALVMALCIKAGFWQYNKAQTKLALQTQLNTRLAEPAIALPDKIANLDEWRYRRVKFVGKYDTRYQILLDNQVENTVAGYHVLTPIQIAGSKVAVLVDRGWIAGAANRQVPNVVTPQGSLSIEGDVSLPTAKFFTLETPPAANDKWQTLWQNIDMQRFAKSVPFAVQPFIVRLDANSDAGGFVRHWPPPGDRVSMHLGYAYQWFGFALTLLVIYVVLNLKKKL